MLRTLALLSLLSVACGAPGTRYVEAPGQDDAELRAEASDAWAAVGVETPEDYTLVFLAPVDLVDACDIDMGGLVPDASVGGCSEPGVILLNAETDPDLQLRALTHELGHLTHSRKGKLVRGHLDCGAAVADGSTYGDDVMCLTGAPLGTLPTLRDAAFVTH